MDPETAAGGDVSSIDPWGLALPPRKTVAAPVHSSEDEFEIAHVTQCAARGGLTAAVYILFGIVGLPVFADRAHGLDVVLGATGGYLLGFILAAVVVGWLAQRQWDRRFSSAVTAMLTGTVIIYAFGLVWLKVDQGLDVATTLEYGLYPFVPGDLLKLYLAGALLPGAWRLISRLRG